MNKKILLGFLAILICLTFLACSQKEPPVFSYDLKDSYSSRTEISKEKESMLYAFADFINDNSRGSQKEKREFYDSNDKIYQSLKSQLDEMYNNMTFSAEEIESSKIAVIDKKVKTWKEGVIDINREIYDSDGNFLPTGEEVSKRYDRQHKAALEIKEDYLNGKITYKQAISKLEKVVYIK